MKAIFTQLLTLCMALCFAACGKQNTEHYPEYSETDITNEVEAKYIRWHSNYCILQESGMTYIITRQGHHMQNLTLDSLQVVYMRELLAKPPMAPLGR